MCSGIAFLAGLFLLFKGQFRVANRTIERPQTRIIALILMAPPIIAFCAGSLIFSGSADITYDQLFTVAVIELGSLVIALGLVAYNIYQIPPTPDYMRRKVETIAAQPQPMPTIMTVVQAASYLRMSETELLRLIDQGKIGAARIGDSYRIAKIALDDYLAGRG